MKNKIKYFAALIALLSAPSLFAQEETVVPVQEKSYEGNVDFKVNRLEQLGDSLYVNMDVKLSGVSVKSEMSVDLTPRIVSESGEALLPPVSIKGRSSYKAYERSSAMFRRAVANNNETLPYVIIAGYPKSDETVNYNYAVYYEPWMAYAKLDVVGQEEGCCNIRLLGSTTVSDFVTMEKRPFIEPLVVNSLLAFVAPQVEEVKSRELRAETHLDFMVNRTNIDPSYMNNPRELARIRGIIDELKDDPAISIKEIEIVGYASPEGSLAANKRLSEGRALALRNYLAASYDFPRNAYKIRFGGENWDGLVKALEAEPFEHSDEVLEIIRTTNPDQTRKNRLMALHSGNTYRYMLSTIYPGLRTAVCEIDYVIKGFSVQDAVEVFKTRPQNLSLNEFYLVSQQLERGSVEFIEVFETAVRMYPDDEIANLNAAIAAIQEGNAEKAEHYLAKVTTLHQPAEYDNAMGALEVLKRNFDAARTHFEKASGKGLAIAKENLERLPSNK